MRDGRWDELEQIEWCKRPSSTTCWRIRPPPRPTFVRPGLPEWLVGDGQDPDQSPEPTSYATRIEAIIDSGNLAAILIKMSDNEDNLSPDRTLPAGEALAARYRTAFGRLKGSRSGARLHRAMKG